jgi:hypothetical protein
VRYLLKMFQVKSVQKNEIRFVPNSPFCIKWFSNLRTGFFGAVSAHNWRTSGMVLIKVL